MGEFLVPLKYSFFYGKGNKYTKKIMVQRMCE